MVALYPVAALRVLAASAHRHRCVGTLAYRGAVEHLRGRANRFPWQVCGSAPTSPWHPASIARSLQAPRKFAGRGISEVAMNTPREPNVRIRSPQALDQPRSWVHQHSAPNIHRPTLTLDPKTPRFADRPVSATRLMTNTGAAKPVT